MLLEGGTPRPEPGQLTVPLRGARVEVSWPAPWHSVVLTVLGADGVALAEVDTDLDWERAAGARSAAALCGRR